MKDTIDNMLQSIMDKECPPLQSKLPEFRIVNRFLRIRQLNYMKFRAMYDMSCGGVFTGGLTASGGYFSISYTVLDGFNPDGTLPKKAIQHENKDHFLLETLVQVEGQELPKDLVDLMEHIRSICQPV